MQYDNDVDGSKVVVAQNSKTKQVFLRQSFDSFVNEGHFIKKENGQLKQTSSKIFLK